jgi:hypothetical protein
MEFHPIVVEQAKGFLREVLDISVDDAYDLLRRYAQTNDDQLTTRMSRQLITEPNSRPAILAAIGRSRPVAPDGNGGRWSLRNPTGKRRRGIAH